MLIHFTRLQGDDAGFEIDTQRPLAAGNVGGGTHQKKHLLTLEPGISENQTDEMRVKELQLVLPQKLHATFRPSQQAWLMNVGEFISLVRGRQGA